MRKYLPKLATEHNAPAFIDDRLKEIIAIMLTYPNAKPSNSYLWRKVIQIFRQPKSPGENTK